MRKSNRGFSFVELLAAIVIMGLLSGLAIVSIRFLTNKAEKEYYKAQENEIVMAAKSYTQDNRNYLPKRVGFKNQIYLKTLQDKKYIGDVVDRGKKKCDPTKSYVQVYRYDKNHYNYVVNLVCNSYKSMDNDDSNITEKPTVKINFLNVSKNDKYSDAKVNLVIEDDNKISSYSYIIIKDGEEVKNSGDIDGKLQTKINTNISLADYVPGKITVKVVATNTFGNQGKASETVTVKNENAPECQIVSDNSAKDVNGNPTCEGKWINNPDSAIVEAQVKCIDKSGSGCQKDVYTQKFFGERKTDAILIKDNTGNSYNCPVHVCIDVTKPTTPVIKNDYENVWTNKPYSIEITSYDETAGIAYFEYRYPNSTGRDGNGVSEREWHKWENSSKSPGDKTPFVTTKFSKERAEYVEVRACDRAGNCSDTAKSMIKIDKTAPTCTITRNKANPDGLNDWYVTNVNLTLNRNDVNGSGDRAVNSPISYELKNTNSASYNGTTTGTQKDTKGITWYGFIKDEAGNKTSCNSGSFKVDTTKPDKPSITNRNDNKWVNKSYTISVVSKDATSGIDYFAYRYPSSNLPGENTWNKYANSSRNPGDNTPFTTTKFSKERGEDVNIKACDLAGNCSDVSVSTIKIDKTAPTITPKYSLVTIGSISEENVADLFTIKYSKSSGSVKCNVSKTANIKASHNPLTCTVTGGSGLTASATIPIKNPLVSIAVTKNPNKMEYRLGDAFDKKGMVVTATYRDGTTKEVKDYTLSVDVRKNDSRRNPRPGGYDINYFSPERIDHIKKINVSYTEDGVTATTDFNVYSYLYTDQIVKYVVVPWKYQVHDISNRPTIWTEGQSFGEYEGYLYFDSSYKNNPYGCKYEIGSNYFKITSTNSSYLCRISYEVFALAKDGSYWDAGYFEKDENYVFSRTSNAVHNTYGTMTWMSNIDNDGRADTSQNYTASIDTLRPRFDMGVACNRGTCTITHTMNSVTVSGKPVPIVTNDLDS